MSTIFYQKRIHLLGINWDKKSSYLQGAALAPNRIREALHCGSGNYWTELTVNPIEHELFEDIGDFPIEEYFDIEKIIEEIQHQGYRSICLGGDHSITYPIIRAYRKHYESFSILQIDAHGDLYDSFENDSYSHACPFARIMEEQLTDELIQVGIRTLNPHQREQAKKYGVTQIEMRDFDAGIRPTLTKPVYLSIDLDGLDPAYAPGVSHHEPGGLSTREVLRLIQTIPVPIIGADIVELNPNRDVSDMTAHLAAKILKEIAGKMLYP